MAAGVLLPLLLALLWPARAEAGFSYKDDEELEFYLPPYGLLVSDCRHIHDGRFRGIPLFAPVSCAFHSQFTSNTQGLSLGAANLQEVTFFDDSLLQDNGILSLCGSGLTRGGEGDSKGPAGSGAGFRTLSDEVCTCKAEPRPRGAAARRSAPGGHSPLSDLEGRAIALADSVDFLQNRELVHISIYACGEPAWGVVAPRRVLLGAEKLTTPLPFTNARLFRQRPMTALDVDSVGIFSPSQLRLSSEDLDGFAKLQEIYSGAGEDVSGTGAYNYIFVSDDPIARETLAGLGPASPYSVFYTSIRDACSRGKRSALWFDSPEIRRAFQDALSGGPGEAEAAGTWGGSGKPRAVQRFGRLDHLRLLYDSFIEDFQNGSSVNSTRHSGSPEWDSCVTFHDLPEDLLLDAKSRAEKAILSMRSASGFSAPRDADLRDFEVLHRVDMLRHLFVLRNGGWIFAPSVLLSRDFGVPGTLYTLLPAGADRHSTRSLGPMFSRANGSAVVSKAISLLCNPEFLANDYWRAGEEALMKSLQALYHEPGRGKVLGVAAQIDRQKLVGVRRGQIYQEDDLTLLSLRWAPPAWAQRAMLGVSRDFFGSDGEDDFNKLSLPAQEIPFGIPTGGIVSLSFTNISGLGEKQLSPKRGDPDAILDDPQSTRTSGESPSQSYAVYIERCGDAYSPKLKGMFAILPPECEYNRSFLGEQFAQYRSWYNPQGEYDFERAFSICGPAVGSALPRACQCTGVAESAIETEVRRRADQSVEWDLSLARYKASHEVLLTGRGERYPRWNVSQVTRPAYYVVNSSQFLSGSEFLKAFVFPCGRPRETATISRKDLAAMRPAATLEVENPALLSGTVLYSGQRAVAGGVPPVYHYVWTKPTAFPLHKLSLFTIMMEKSLQAICNAGGTMHWWSMSPLSEKITGYINRLPVVRTHPECVQFSTVDLGEISRDEAHERFLRDYVKENADTKYYPNQLSDLLKAAVLAKFGGAVLQEDEMVYQPLGGDSIVLSLGRDGYSPSPAYSPSPDSSFFNSVIDFQMNQGRDGSDPGLYGSRALGSVVRGRGGEPVDTLPANLVFAPLPPNDIPEQQYTAGSTEEDIYTRYTAENLPYPHFDALPRFDDLCSSKLGPGLSRRVMEVVTRKCYCHPDVDRGMDLFMGLGGQQRE